MDIKPIKTDADYRAALKEIEPLMMIRRLHSERGIPAESLIKKTEKAEPGIASTSLYE